MAPSPSRRKLLRASVLPAALSLAGCGLFRSGGDPVEGPVTADGSGSVAPPSSPDRCLSAPEAAQRSRPTPPEHEDVGPENEALPGEHLATYGLALFAAGDRIAANQTSDAMMLGESDTFGTVVWSTDDGSILERFDNGLTGAITADHRGRLAIGGVVNVEIRESDGTLARALSGGDEPFGPRIGHRISDLVFTADGSRLVVLGADGRITVWAVDDGACRMENELATDLTSVIALSISPVDGILAVCGEGGPVELWDPSTGARTGTVEGVPGTPAGLAHADDGTLIIGTDGERAVHAVDPTGALTTGPSLTASGPYWVAATTGGRVAVVGRRDNRVLLWERETDEAVELPVVPGVTGRLLFSSDGGTLYGACPSEGVIAWSGSGDWRRFDTP